MSKRNDDRLQRLVGCFRDTTDDLVFWSFRYFLGRVSIHTCCFAQDLARAWPHLDQRVAALIRRELDEAFERDDKARRCGDAETRGISLPLGMDCERQHWDMVRRAYTAAGSDASASSPIVSTGLVGGED